MEYKNHAFTLAEALIVLGIVGVVAALTLPTLIKNFQTFVKETQIKVITTKINQGIERMQVKGSLNYNYSDTREYVEELSKEMKILNICDSDHIVDCWGYDNIITRKNKPAFSVADSKDAKQTFDKTLDDGSDFSSSVGVILGNGTPMILSYDKNCELFDPDTKYTYEEITSCIVGVYDINGKRGPNKFGEDVIGFNAGRFGGSCTIEIGSACFTSTPFKPKPLTHDECIRLKDKLGITYCMDHDLDYWGGAVKTCGHKSKLPDINEIREVLIDLYGSDNVSSTDSYMNVSGVVLNTNSSSAKLLGFTNLPYSIWMDNETSDPRIDNAFICASNIRIESTSYRTQAYTFTRGADNPWAICAE